MPYRVKLGGTQSHEGFVSLRIASGKLTNAEIVWLWGVFRGFIIGVVGLRCWDPAVDWQRGCGVVVLSALAGVAKREFVARHELCAALHGGDGDGGMGCQGA